MKEVPRRLLMLGGGPVGVEMAQAVRRMGGEVALIEGADHVLSREPRAARRGARRGARGRGIEFHFGQHASAARRDGDDYVLEFDDGSELRGDHLLVATGRRPRVTGSAWRRSASSRRHGASRSTTRMSRRRAAVGDRRRDRHLAADLRRQVPGRGRGRQHPRASRARPTTRPCRASSFTDPQAAAVGGAEGRGQRDRAAWPGCRKTATYTRAYAESNGFLTLVSRRRAADRRVRGRARRPASGCSRPRSRSAPACRSTVLQGHDPAVPDVLRDLRAGPEEALGSDR